MATAHREQIAKQLLQAHVSTSEVDGRVLVQRKPPGSKPQGRGHGAAAGGREGGRPVRRSQPHPHHPPHRLQPAPTTAELEQRELGWNDRFCRDSPSQPKRPQRTLTQRSTAAGETVHAQDAKEKKIRDERRQYGHGSSSTTSTTSGAMNKPQRPGMSRLLPIGSLPLPPREPEAASSKQEKLRFKVLQAIDLRETLLYQLNALILCTPVQEALVMAASRVVVQPTEAATHGGVGGASTQQLKPRATMALAATATGATGPNAPIMSNAREATRLAQQLASDLQIAGIQAVEGMVEWMLEAGAKADKPPEFLWRGRHYFLKMESDLDFAGPELRVRGVDLDCFSLANPLCVRPDQRLGRVLAAQSIIHEMVTMARQQQQQQQTQEETPRGDARKASGRKEKSSRTPRRQETTDDGSISPRTSSVVAVLSTKADAAASQQSADEMILLSTTRDNDGGDEEGESGDQDDAFTSARSVEQVGVERNEVEGSNQDAEAEKEELVDLLDESFSGTTAIEERAMTDTLPIPDPIPPHNGSVKSSARDEYESSFDADTAAEQEHGITRDAPNATPGEPEEPSPSKEPATETVDEVAGADNQLECTRPAATAASVAPATPTKADQKEREWEQVAQLLRTMGYSCSSSGDDGDSGSELQQRAAWAKNEETQRGLQSALARDPLVAADALAGSLLQLLLEAPNLRNKIAIVCDDRASTHVQLHQRLVEECQVVVREICTAIAAALHRELQQLSSLVSEVDFTDVLDAAARVFRDHTGERGALPYLTQAMEIMHVLYSPSNQTTNSPSVGFSQLIHVFYPYLTNQRRDRLVRSWDQLTKLLQDHIHLDVESIAFALDATCKVLLLNVASLRRGSDREEIPKLTLVCDRANVLDSSVAAAHRKWLSSHELLLPQYHLYPFFLSSFGEKRVDGEQVEEGEGTGPLKEWFTLVARELTAKWRAVPLPPSALTSHSTSTEEFDPVLVNGNKLVVDRMEAVLQPGYRVEWQSRTDDTTVSRILNKCDPAMGTYLLDRGGLSNQSFPVSELCVFQPRIAILEYMQASESYWLNGSLVDTPLNRHTIAFVGWLFANALVHQCALQLRVHRLLFELLLRGDDSEWSSITLHDLQSLDPSLWTALQQMKRMKPAEFASYLEFEGVAGASTMSVDDYISQTIQEKYGATSSVAWQLQELRSGFRRVFTTDELKLARLSADDLVDQLSGSGSTAEKDRVDLDQVFRMSLDPDFASCSPLRRSFWTAVNGFDDTLKRQLVKFITGVDTLPQPNTEFLRIEMPFPATSPSDLNKTLRMLPQSHTCDNTLELPHYWRALCWEAQHDAAQPSATIESKLVVLLSQKLRLAAEYSSGYGLDGTATTTISLSSMLPGSHSTNDDQQLLSAQESYDSLDLPALGDGSMASGRGSKSPVEMGRREEEDVDTVVEAEEEQKKEETQIGVVSSPLACPDMAEKEKEEEAYGAEDWEEEELAD